MISAEDLSNSGKNKVTKKTSEQGNILKKVKLKNLSRPRERKLNLKLSIFQLKQTFRVIIENTITHALSILTRFDINFFENA